MYDSAATNRNGSRSLRAERIARRVWIAAAIVAASSAASSLGWMVRARMQCEAYQDQLRAERGEDAIESLAPDGLDELAADEGVLELEALDDERSLDELALAGEPELEDAQASDEALLPTDEPWGVGQEREAPESEPTLRSGERATAPIWIGGPSESRDEPLEEEEPRELEPLIIGGEERPIDDIDRERLDRVLGEITRELRGGEPDGSVESGEVPSVADDVLEERTRALLEADPALDLDFEQVLRGAMSVLFPGLLGALLLLVHRVERDRRLAFAGALLIAVAVSTGGALIEWNLRRYSGLNALPAPLAMVAFGVIAVAAPHRRTLLLVILVVAWAARVVRFGPLFEASPTSAWFRQLAIAISVVLESGVLVAVFADHASRARRNEHWGGDGPYRSARLRGQEDDGRWAARATFLAAFAFPLVGGALRASSAAGLTDAFMLGEHLFAIVVALAVASTLAAMRSLGDARRAFSFAAWFLWVLPLSSLAYALLRPRPSLLGLFSSTYGLDSGLLLFLWSACFAGSACAALVAVSATAALRARTAKSEPPMLRPIEVAVVTLGASPVPWLVKLDAFEIDMPWPLLLAAAVVGALVLGRYLRCVSRWFDSLPDEAPVAASSE